MIFKRWFGALCLALPGMACVTPAGGATISVVDDAGRQVTLAAPARRIISMAPHVTELLFAASGGERIVGAVNFSDHLGKLGIPVFYSEPGRLDQVAASLSRFGTLLGTEKVAAASATQFRASIAALKRRHGQRAPVRVFYQIWDKPIYTLSSKHIINDAIALCGGENVFAGLNVVAPSVSTEAVLQANPEAIFGGDQHDPIDAGISIWTSYRSLLGVERATCSGSTANC